MEENSPITPVENIEDLIEDIESNQPTPEVNNKKVVENTDDVETDEIISDIEIDTVEKNEIPNDEEINSENTNSENAKRFDSLEKQISELEKKNENNSRYENIVKQILKDSKKVFKPGETEKFLDKMHEKSLDVKAKENGFKNVQEQNNSIENKKFNTEKNEMFVEMEVFSLAKKKEVTLESMKDFKIFLKDKKFSKESPYKTEQLYNLYKMEKKPHDDEKMKNTTNEKGKNNNKNQLTQEFKDQIKKSLDLDM